MTDIRRGYAGKPGAQVHYRRLGAGPALVLLAPTPRSSNYYVTLMPLLRDFTVIALDTPGFGLSDALRGHWRMEDLAGRIAQALDDLGIARYSVLGIHGGNKIGAALSASHPHRVDRLLFAGMTHSIVLDNATRNRAMRSFYANPEATDDPGRPAPEETRRAQRWHHVGKTIAATWNGYDPALSGAAGADARSRARRHVVDEVMGFDGFDELYTANFSFDLEGVLRALAVATVVIEMVIPQEDHLGRQAETLVAAIPRASSITLNGTDRALVTSRADLLADAIRQALALAF
jgi:pimeloyl-ACP methyl ester carboxylesterase